MYGNSPDKNKRNSLSQAQEHESLHTSRQDAGPAIRHSKPRSLGDWGVRDRGCARGGTGPARDCAKELVCAAVLEIAIRAVRRHRKRVRLSGCSAAGCCGGALVAPSPERPTMRLCPQPIKSLSCSISFSE